ncbi:hypothetical protein THF1C08_50327 [Vibrio jasicida]|nr:hypothetical protein THF1C08_50327 [Vibrio jasicida]
MRYYREIIAFEQTKTNPHGLHSSLSSVVPHTLLKELAL